MAAPELKTLGRYTIERVLGKGAMGVVYEGVDPRLSRHVAIKTILKSHLDEDTAKDYSMRFEREALAVARLNHPHIVQVHDFGEEGDVAYLVMEFIRGKELKSFFDANERFDIKEAVRIMCELLDALEFAHNAGIIHRDIKPANVMLDSQGHTKLTDFGVARVQDVDRTQAVRTQAGTMVGTPAYMSPEQITGGHIDRRTDVFSAGIILYQFLTGGMPFTGGAWTVAKKIMQDQPALPSSIDTSVTPLFDAVVNKALAKDPDQRYQSAKDFGVALKRALHGQGEEGDSDKTVVGSIASAPAARPAPTAARPAPRPAAAVEGRSATQTGSQEVELEFWRAIKDGNDPDDFDLYVQQFPTGIYAALAKRKIAKLKGVASEETGAKAKQTQEQEQREAEEASRREAAAMAKLAAQKAKQEAELAKREAELKQRETEAEAKREAEAKARADAEEKTRREAIEKAKQEAAARAKAEAEGRARREAEEKARRETEAKLAKRESELKKREAEGPKKPAPVLPAIIVGVMVAAIGGGVWYVMKPDASVEAKRVAELRKQLEEAKRREAELQQAKLREAAATKELELAQQREAEAKKSGDLAKQRELAEQTRQHALDAKKTAEAAKQREAELAKLQTEAKRQQADAAKQREVELAKQREAEQAKQREELAKQQREAAELGFWNSIKGSTNPRDFDEYLRRYPSGHFAVLAKATKENLVRLDEEAKKLAAEREEQRRQQEARMEEERHKIREQELRLRESRARQEELERQKTEMEKKQRRVYVPPTF